ncbi:MAG: penicillin-binding protein 2 [Candidatus Margulisiibacteriota bacterium]|jgi:penicillin-binding protein 2
MNDPFLIQEDNKQIRDKHLNNFYKTRYVGEQSGLFNENSAVRLIFKDKNILIFSSLILLFFIIIFFRVAFLQIYQGKQFIAQAEGNRIKTEVIKATRGIIYDINNEVLAKNIPSFSLNVLPSEVSDNKILVDYLQILNKITPLDTNEILEKMEKFRQFVNQPVTIVENIPYEQALQLMVQTTNMPGISVISQSSRWYTQKNILAHSLGYLGSITEKDLDLVRTGQYQLNDKLGKSGLELYYEPELKGVDGHKKIEVNAWGEELQVLSEEKSVNGQSLILYLDNKLQQIIYEELTKVLKSGKFSKAAAIAIDPRTGGIKAAVSLPSFDNNYFINSKVFSTELSSIFNDELNPLFFRPVQGSYPSGSIIKPIYAAAALEENIINKNTTVLSTGGIRVNQWFFPDWKAGGHGLTNVIKAIAESVNTFFYYIGGGYESFKGLGISNLKKYALIFGLSSPTGVDFPDETEGFFPDPDWKESVKKERWYIGDTYNVSIGQGDVLVSPLQMANVYAAIVNGGTFYQPRFVKALKDEATGLINEIVPIEKNKQIISSANLDIIKQGLRSTVETGSARYLNQLPIKVAGKTGTAQVGGNNQSHAWFAGYAPYDNPEMVLIILIENGIEGSSYAVPVAYNVWQRYYAKSE